MSTSAPTDLVPTIATESEPTVVFPNGLVGCGNWKRFVLMVDDEQELPVAVLRCLDEPIDLMVTQPALALPGYRVALSPEERAQLELQDGEQPILYCTLSLTDDGWLTANLLGPLAINPRLHTGKQLVLTESTYSTRHPIAHVGHSDGEGSAC